MECFNEFFDQVVAAKLDQAVELIVPVLHQGFLLSFCIF